MMAESMEARDGMTDSSHGSLINTLMQMFVKTKAPIAIVLFFLLTTPGIRADTLKEYIYLDGKAVAVDASTPANICTYGISPTSASPATGGGSGSVSVTATTGCSWTTTNNASSLVMSVRYTTGRR